MRVEYLEEFVALARFLSFTETANKLNMSQPTLSKHINSLEHELKAPLFERRGNSLLLTKAGQLVLPHAFDLIESKDRIMVAAKEGMSMLTPHLKIGGSVGLRTVLEKVNLLSSVFAERYGTEVIEISDVETEPTSLLDMNSDDAPDLLFSYLDETNELEADTETRLVEKAPLVAVINKGHRLASRETLKLTDLENDPLIKLEGNYATEMWRFIEVACLSAGFSPRCKHVYFPRITDFLNVTFRLDTEVLVLTDDFYRQFQAFISPNCVMIPIDDPFAFMPLSVAYSMSNSNPLIDEALEIIFATDAKGA